MRLMQGRNAGAHGCMAETSSIEEAGTSTVGQGSLVFAYNGTTLNECLVAKSHCLDGEMV
jgi:hypothetical protein